MKRSLMTHTLLRRINNTTNANKSIVPGRLVVFMAVLLSLQLSSCKKESAEAEMKTANAQTSKQLQDAFVGTEDFLLPTTVRELKAARAATAKYQNIENAIKDGYADISVVVQHMGFHYMKASLADDKFEIEKPEILVYNKNHQGHVELVAVEYAVPIPLTPNAAPQGFTGDADVWTYSTTFNLWLLHAWVWEYNPAGIFNPTNPLIHLH